MAPINISLQISLGCFAVAVDDADTVKVLKTKLRTAVPQLSHVNLKGFRFNLNGNYLSDESKSLKDCDVHDGSLLHAVKKSTCPRAALDTEKPAADE